LKERLEVDHAELARDSIPHTTKNDNHESVHLIVVRETASLQWRLERDCVEVFGALA
jgi:hypothetical protein